MGVVFGQTNNDWDIDSLEEALSLIIQARILRSIKASYVIEVRNSLERDIWFLHVMLQGSYQMWRVLGTPPSSAPPSRWRPPPAPRRGPPTRPPWAPPPPGAPYAFHTDQVRLDGSYMDLRKSKLQDRSFQKIKKSSFGTQN